MWLVGPVWAPEEPGFTCTLPLQRQSRKLRFICLRNGTIVQLSGTHCHGCSSDRNREDLTDSQMFKPRLEVEWPAGWVPLCPNVLISKLTFILSILETTSQSLLCYSACSIENLLKSKDFHSVVLCGLSGTHLYASRPAVVLVFTVKVEDCLQCGHVRMLEKKQEFSPAKSQTSDHLLS